MTTTEQKGLAALAEISEGRKWWGRRVYASLVGRDRGLPGFLGGIAYLRDGKRVVGYSARYTAPGIDTVMVGPFKTRRAAVAALVAYHLARK